MTKRGCSRGVALPLVLLFLVALTLVGHGALYLALRELEVARASARDLRGRLAAESAVRMVEAGWPHEAAGSLEEGGVLPAGTVALTAGVWGVATIRRLGLELYLVEGTSRQESWPGESRAARLFWVVDPRTAARSFGAVAEVGGAVTVAPGARLEGSGLWDPPQEWDAVCPALSEETRALFPGGALPAVKPLLSDAADSGLPGAEALLGPLTVSRLQSLSSRFLEGAVAPAPRIVSGVCDRGSPFNWGSPRDPGGACGDHFPLVAARGALTVEGGEGQGVLVAREDLRLRADARFIGMVLVAGDLILEGDARIDGLVRVLGRLELRDRSRIDGSACGAIRAIRGARELGNAVPLPTRSWISPY